MDPLIILALIGVGVFAGIIGALFGLGGGIVFVPFLTIAFGLSAMDAAAVSLIGIVASSVGAASKHVEQRRSNIRLGLLLEVATAIGAIAGAFIAGFMADWILLCVFSAMLLYSALHMILHKEHITEPATASDDPMCFEYTDDKGENRAYKVENVKGGMLGCAAAGVLASMTGVGGGSIKVPLMNIYMHIPIKLASATSSYMIGITSFSGAIVFLLNGHVLLDYAAGLSIGAFLGAIIGVRLSGKLKSGDLRKYLSIVLIIVAVLELLKAGGIM